MGARLFRLFLLGCDQFGNAQSGPNVYLFLACALIVDLLRYHLRFQPHHIA